MAADVPRQPSSDQSRQPKAAPVRRVFEVLFLIGILLATLCLAAQLVIISINVIMRYFRIGSGGISWVEEISKDVLLTALTFLAMAIGVHLDSHIDGDLFPRKIPAWLDKSLWVLRQLVGGGVGLFLACYGVILMRILQGSIASAPSLPIDLQFVFVPFAGLLIFGECLLNLLGVAKRGASLDDMFMAIGEKR